MFEFGKDLRRLFEKARDSTDLGWLEVISTVLVENEARHQSLDAGRLACPQPFHSSLRASLLWREHARRTGKPQSLERAESEARAASRHASNEEQKIRASIELATASLLAFDLTGGPERLTSAEGIVASLPMARRPHLNEALEITQARIAARRAALTGSVEALSAACETMERAVQQLKGPQRLTEMALRIEQTSLSLDLGLMTRDLRRLDQAGQDLKALVEDAPSEQRPITRGRALALCGAGMLALAKLAKDVDAKAQARTLLDAAADQITMDHSPLDWSVIQLMRAKIDEAQPLMTLIQVEALTEDHGLILGAEARERRLAHEIHETEAARDLVGLRLLEARILSHLYEQSPRLTPLDWAANQIALAQISLARSRLTGEGLGQVGMVLIEAADTARSMGAISLADRARDLLPHPQTV